VILVSLGGDDGFAQIGPDDPARTSFFVFFFVAADAVIPIFPGETTLNAASAFAADGDLQLWLVILLGALAAIVGDSALYWIARRSSARITPQLERARKNKRVAGALDFLDRGAPVLLVFGRYVPGLRFVINATMGMNRYPYGKYLPWSALGGVLWSTYTCLLAYKVGSSLDNYPLASTYISGLITTGLMAVISCSCAGETGVPTRIHPKRVMSAHPARCWSRVRQRTEDAWKVTTRNLAPSTSS
jgi:membrane-associated protein